MYNITAITDNKEALVAVEITPIVETKQVNPDTLIKRFILKKENIQKQIDTLQAKVDDIDADIAKLTDIGVVVPIKEALEDIEIIK